MLRPRVTGMGHGADRAAAGTRARVTDADLPASRYDAIPAGIFPYLQVRRGASRYTRSEAKPWQSSVNFWAHTCSNRCSGGSLSSTRRVPAKARQLVMRLPRVKQAVPSRQQRRMRRSGGSGVATVLLQRFWSATASTDANASTASRQRVRRSMQLCRALLDVNPCDGRRAKSASSRTFVRYSPRTLGELARNGRVLYVSPPPKSVAMAAMLSANVRIARPAAPLRARVARSVASTGRRTVAVRAAAPRDAEAAKAAVVGALVAALSGAPLMEAAPAYAVVVRARAAPFAS